MADTKTESKRSGTQEEQRGLARREGRALQRMGPGYFSPFDMIERMSEEMDRWFDDLTRGLGFPRWSPLSRARLARRAQEGVWDGVLEIRMPAPPEEARRGRRIEITEGSSS
jgi:hypothetical protein